MLFNSHVFLFAFLPIALAGFFAAGRVSLRAAVAWLVLASLFFYGWWEPKYLLLLLGSLTFDYVLGAAIARSATVDPRKSRALLALCLTVDLGVLGWFKYAHFFAESFASLTGTAVEFARPVLPVAIAFYTFQQIAYVVDCHRTGHRERSFLSYLAFVTFFPHEIAGPLVNHRDMLPQFSDPETVRFRPERFGVGLTLLAVGLFKKVTFADVLARFATPVFDAADRGLAIGAVDAWIGAVAYALQIYFDFSGYSDMAIGLGWMFNIRLPLNFDSPYQATSVVDFWRRWHISLSRFLRDYLYVSLGGNRRGPVRRYANLMVTMLLGGLWHGAGWNFVIWGGLHGLYLCAGHGFSALTPRRLPRVPAIALTFAAVTVAWVFFRAASLGGALRVLEGLAFANGPVVDGSSLALAALFRDDLTGYVQAAVKGAIFVVGLVVVFWLPNVHDWLGEHAPAIPPDGRSSRPVQGGFRPEPRFAIGAAVLASLAILQLSQVSEFIYYNF